MKRQLDTAQAQAAPVKKQAKQADMASAVTLCDGNNVATVAPTMPQPVALPTPGSVTPTNLVNAGWTYPPMPIMPFGPFMMPFGPFMPFPFWMPAAAAAAASAMMMPGGGLMGQQAPIASASTAPVCPATTATTSASTGTVPSAPGSAMTEAVAAPQQSTVHCAKENCTGAVVYPKGNSPCPTPDLNSEVCSPSVATESSNDATDDEFHFFIDNFLGASDTFDSTANGLPHVDSLFGFFDGSLDAPEELKF